MNALLLLFWCYIYSTAIVLIIKRCGAAAVDAPGGSEIDNAHGTCFDDFGHLFMRNFMDHFFSLKTSDILSYFFPPFLLFQNRCFDTIAFSHRLEGWQSG